MVASSSSSSGDDSAAEIGFGDGMELDVTVVNDAKYYCYARHDNYHGSRVVQFGTYVGTKERCKTECVKENSEKLGTYPATAVGPLPTAKDVDCRTGGYPVLSDIAERKQSCNEWRVQGNKTTGVDYAKPCPEKDADP